MKGWNMNNLTQLEIPVDSFDVQLVQGSTRNLMRSTGTSSRELYSVPVDLIRRLENFNVRIHDAEYEAHIEWLTGQILENGYDAESVMRGFVAKSGDELVLYLKDGYSRLAAIERANKLLPDERQVRVVPMVVAQQGTSVEDMTADLILSNSGKQLRPFEQSIAIKRLSRYGWSPEDIAKRVGMTVVQVNGLLMLAGAPPAIRDMVIAGQVSATTAIAEMTKHGDKAVERLAKGLEVAQATGRTKVTAKHLPGVAFKRVVTKSAPDLYTAAKNIASDPGYAALSDETKAMLDGLLAKLKTAEEDLLADQSGEEGSADLPASEEVAG